MIYQPMPRENKSHDRAPDKMSFSVALKRTLVAEINRYADAEGRNRNAQIAWMLNEAVQARKHLKATQAIIPRF